jgi:hypothetical protein
LTGNALTDINSITSENGSDLTLGTVSGSDEVVIDIDGVEAAKFFDDSGLGSMFTGRLETPQVNCFGQTRSATFSTVVQQESESGGLVIDHSQGAVQLITLTSDFGLSEIQNIGPGDSGVIYLKVPANADITYDNNEGIGAFKLLGGNVSTFEQALPAGGTEEFDRWWQIKYHKWDLDEVYLETPVGPINTE